MPEGHTLHRLARDMQELAGQSLSAQSPQGKFATSAALVDGQRCDQVDAHGKHLLIDFASGSTVHVHLGMRGKFLRFSPVTGSALKQVRLRLLTETVAWDLIAPSACDLFDPESRSALVAKLGPDPLRADANEDLAIANLAGYKGPIGGALMDQAIISGVGNVFRAEALHQCQIHPLRPADDLAELELRELWTTLQMMMKRAVDDGRIITVASSGPAAPPEAESRRVYKRSHCHDCGTPIETFDIDGRVAYVCPRCQAR